MRRTVGILAVVLVAMALLSTACGDSAAPSRSPQEVAGELPRELGAPEPSSGGPTCGRDGDQGRDEGLGISPGFTVISDDRATVELELDGIAATSVCWVRIDIDWSRIQVSRDELRWAATDRAVEGARARGMEVLALVGYTPAWARPDGTSDKHPPSDPHAFAQFAETAARRYAPLGVHTWEIWNEPNIDDFWQPRPDPAAYLELLNLAAASIREVDVDALIVSAGLSPASNGESSIAPITFLDALYEANAADSFDAVGMHPYSYPEHPTDARPLNHFSTILPEMRRIMDHHGDADTPIWATEFGAPTGTSQQAVSPDEQAQHLAAAIQQWQSWEWTGPLFIYSWRDRGTDVNDREENFGLLYHDFQPKPALDLLLTITGGTAP